MFVMLSFSLVGVANGAERTVAMPFDGNTWVLITTGSFCRGIEEHRDIEIFEGRAGLAYYFRKGLAVSFEVHTNVFQGSQKYDSGEKQEVDTVGIGILPMLRWHFLHNPRWSLYLDYGVGPIFTFKAFPPHGTQVNGTPQFGLGVTVHVRNRLNVIGGIRKFHISNGTGMVSSNPSFDGIVGYAGVAYTF